MTAANHDLEITAGAKFGPVQFTFKDSAGDAVDLTGWNAWAQVRKVPLGQIIHDLTPEITDATGGIVTLAQTDEQTATIQAGAFRWDLLLENSEGERLGPFVSGSCVVSRPITQP